MANNVQAEYAQANNAQAEYAQAEYAQATGVVPAFEVRDVSFAYGTKQEVSVFANLTCSIKKGLITTLIGANGSGKSTLFGLLTKNLIPQQGQLSIEGEALDEVRLTDFARKVAIVHQRNTAPGDLSVEKLVSYGRFPYRKPGRIATSEEDDRMVAKTLELTGLSDLANKPISSLSGGQMQRAWIAMALAQGTDVLLLDEPTTFLDVRYQLELLELVKRLNRNQGITIVMVLHDINQAIQCSDEVMALANGRIVAQGSPQEIVTPDLLQQVYGVQLPVEKIHGAPYVLSAQLPAQAASSLTASATSAAPAPTTQAAAALQPTAGKDTLMEATSSTQPLAATAISVTALAAATSSAPATLTGDLDLDAPSTPKKRHFRYLWASGGFIAFGLGLLGTVLPFLPTTPLILLAAFCFAHSSERLNSWFKSTKVYKRVLKDYVNKRTMTVKAKLSILIPVTILLAIGFLLMSNVLVGRIVVAVVWVAHVLYFGFIVKTERNVKHG